MYFSASGLFRKCLVVILVAFVLFILLPLDQVNAQEKETYQQQIKVLYRLTDVVVRDHDGNFVKGLKPEDFRLLIDGKEVEVKSIEEFNSISPKEDTISRYVVEANKAKAEGRKLPEPPSQPRHVILVFDVFNSGPQGLRAAKKSANALLDTAFLPYDRCTVFQYNNALKYLIGPTTDREKIREAIENVHGPSHNNFYLPMREEILPPKNSREQGRLKLMNLEKRSNFRNFLDALRELADALAFLPGRKSYLIFSEGPNLYDPLADQNSGNQKETTISRSNDIGTLLGSLEARSDQGGIDSHVASSNSTFYTIRRGPVQPPWTLGTEIDLRDDRLFVLKKKKGVTDKSYNEVANQPQSGSRNAGDLSNGGQIAALSKLNDMQRGRLDILRDVARMTNGKFYDAGMNDKKLAEKLVEEIGNFYLLGFSVPQKASNKYYDMRIETRDRSLLVVHRKGFSSGKEFKDLTADERELQINKALVAGAGPNQMELETSIYQIMLGEKATALYYLQLDASKLQADSEGKYELEQITTVEDQQGTLRFRKHTVYHSDVSGSDEKYWLTGNVPILSDNTVIKFVLRDNVSGNISVERKVLKSVLDGETRLILAQPVFLLPPKSGSIKEWQAAEIEDHVKIANPIESAGIAIPGMPNYRNVFRQGESASVLFLICNLPDGINPKNSKIFADFIINCGGIRYRLIQSKMVLRFLENSRSLEFVTDVPIGLAQSESGVLELTVRGIIEDVYLNTALLFTISDFSESKAMALASDERLKKISQ